MTNKKKIKEKLSETPDIPGVYLMNNREGDVIYIGKALSLKKRIGSYFHQDNRDIKNRILSSAICDFDFVPVASEAEALVLENRLIKKHRPKYNINLKDDKSYPLVKITREKFPTIRVVREKKDGRSLYFGPFTNAELIRSVIKFIRRYYPMRNCRADMEKRKTRLCTQYHIGRCSGPCEGKISEREYGSIVKGVVSFLQGKYAKFERELEKELSEQIQKLEFEKAAETKKKLFMLQSMEKKFPIRDEESLLLYSDSGVLQNLKELLKINKMPYHIEGYDISNISGFYAAAGKVSFKGGAKDSKNYRRYRIKSGDAADDCKMMQEVLTRRFDSEREREELPDLILIDGGKGQLNAAVKALKSLKIDIPVISLAKKREVIYIAGQKRFLGLQETSKELLLLQAVRDEAHRFSVAYHRNIRKRSVRSSPTGKTADKKKKLHEYA